jgi:hypothetical protein
MFQNLIPASQRKLAVFCLFSIFTFHADLQAQSTSGSITGAVTDSSGAAIASTAIELRELGSNRTLNTESSAGGDFIFSGLAPGLYQLKASLSGFKTAQITQIEVRVAQTTTQNVTLELGQVSDQVTVSGEAPLISPSSAAVTTTVQNKLLQDLPFQDRSALSAILLTPGSQGDPQYSGGVQSEMPAVFTQAVTPGGSVTVGGGRPGGGSILVDGSDVTSAGNPRAVMTFSSDTVQEVSIQANGIAAQYGRTTAGIVNQATKSGTNDFHGSGFYNHTQPYLQTRFLGSAFGPTARYSSYAGAIGGPVVIPKVYNGRNKTFFWATGEPQRQRLAIGASRVRLPTSDELAGKFNNLYDFLDSTLRASNINAAIASPIRTNSLRYHYNLNANGFPTGPELPVANRAVIPNNDLSGLLARNPQAQNIIKTLFPFTPGVDTQNIRWLRPDGLFDIDGNNAIFVRGVESTDNRYSFKIDQLVGSSDRLAFRYSVVPVVGTRYDWGGTSDPGGPIIQDKITSYNTGVTYNHLFSATFASEFRATYSRGDAFRGPNAASLSRDWGPTLGLLPAVSGVGFPQILGRGANGEGRTLDVNFGMGADFTLSRGKHTFKMGGEHRRIQLNRLSFSGLTGGNYSFSGQITPNVGGIAGIADQIGGLITGSLNNYTFQGIQSNAYYRWRYTAGYFQDDWKLTSKLTLNVGLRYDVETPRTEKYDRQGWFDPSVTGTVNGKQVTGAYVWAGTDGRQRNLFPMNYRGLQPRIGIAYAAKSWLVARASYSLLRAPLTGYGNALYPDANVNTSVINSSLGIGGVNPGPVNLITNPIAPLPAPNVLPRTPIFSMNDTNTFAFSLIPQNNAMPRVDRWNAGFQMLLSNNLSLDIGYDGSKGTHLYAQPWGVNAVPLSVSGPLAATGADFATQSPLYNPLGIRSSNGSIINGTLLQSLRPYPNFFNNRFNADYDRSGNSTYHGLNIGLQKRFSGGLVLLGSYSWSKSLDDGTPSGNDIFGITNLQSQNREKSLSNFDLPHKIRASFSYELPFGKGKRVLGATNALLNNLVGGYVLSGTFARSSGLPGVIYMGNNGWYTSAVGGAGNDGWTIRPDRVSGLSPVNPTWREDPFRRSYFNNAAFAVPGSSTAPAPGNVARTLGDARSPNTTSFDASIAKNFAFFKEKRINLQLRADAFNVLNHPVFFLNPNSRSTGVFEYLPSTRSFRPNPSATSMDANNTGQFGNYAGRMFRVGARLSF